MKIEVAKKWVKALRSGKYKQGKQILKYISQRGTVRHCCLGVLCELYQKDHKSKLATGKIVGSNPDPDLPKGSVGIHFDEEDGQLPKKVMRWAGMKSAEGVFLCDDKCCFPDDALSLVNMNDDGYNFKRIADVIESRSDDL